MNTPPSKLNSYSPEQLVLDLPHRSAMNAEDFLVSNCNEAAVKLIDIWPDWPHNTLLIVGPAGAGKTHLANVWRMKAKAHLLSHKSLSDEEVDVLKNQQAVILENVDTLFHNTTVHNNETAFFHLLNLSKEYEFSILLTARSRPGTWDIHLPDLRSRLRAAPVIEIQPPDSILLDTILVKLFNDRQLQVAPNLIRFISVRMERSMASAQKLVEALDKAALARGRKVTRQLASELMQDMGLMGGESQDVNEAVKQQKDIKGKKEEKEL